MKKNKQAVPRQVSKSKRKQASPPSTGAIETGPQPAKPEPSAAVIRIRMYRVGFGDCFLVSFPNQQGSKYVLVDCGVHARGDIKTMDRIVRNVQSECQNKLAIVIATHEHQDHISGFGQCSDVF